MVAEFVAYYNTERLHSAIGYLTPKDKLDGREPEIFAAREEKLHIAREQRRICRSSALQAKIGGTLPLTPTRFVQPAANTKALSS